MKWVLLLLRVGFGGMWIWAGVPKVLDPRGFLGDVRAYDLVGDPWAALVAFGLPWLEVFAGLAIIAGRWLYRGSLVVSLGLLVGFLGGIVSAWVRGLDIECGCFGGGGEKGQYLWWTVRDVLLIGWCGVLMAAEWRHGKAEKLKS